MNMTERAVDPVPHNTLLRVHWHHQCRCPQPAGHDNSQHFQVTVTLEVTVTWRNITNHTLGEGALRQRWFWEYNIRSDQGLGRRLDFLQYNHARMGASSDWPTGLYRSFTGLLSWDITRKIGAGTLPKRNWIWNAVSRKVVRHDAPY